MIRFTLNIIPHIVISLIATLAQSHYHGLPQSFHYVLIFHFWYYVCFSHVVIFKVKRFFFLKLLHAFLFVPFWFVASMYCSCFTYHISYLLLFSAYLHLQYGQYKKQTPDILCISNKFLDSWPNIHGYRVIGELKFSDEEIETIKTSIKNLKPNVVLWSAEFGNGFREILGLCLENEICLNISEASQENNDKLPDNKNANTTQYNIRRCSIEDCITSYTSTSKISGHNIVICGSDITLMHRLFTHFSAHNEVWVMYNQHFSSAKYKLKKLFNNKIVYDLEDFLHTNTAKILHIGGITSLHTRSRTLDMFSEIEHMSYLSQKYQSNFILITTHNYGNNESTHQYMNSLENITKQYNGSFIRIPYVLSDIKFNSYHVQNNKNITDNGSWLNATSVAHYIQDFMIHHTNQEIHGTFLSKQEIQHCANLVQRSWNVWPKTIDYVRGHIKCNHLTSTK